MRISTQIRRCAQLRGLHLTAWSTAIIPGERLSDGFDTCVSVVPGLFVISQMDYHNFISRLSGISNKHTVYIC